MWTYSRQVRVWSTADRPSWLCPTVHGATTRHSWSSSLAIGSRTSRAPPSSTLRKPALCTLQSWATTATEYPDDSSPVWSWRPSVEERYHNEGGGVGPWSYSHVPYTVAPPRTGCLWPAVLSLKSCVASNLHIMHMCCDMHNRHEETWTSWWSI